MNPIAPPRSPVTAPGYHLGRTPANKGHRYPAEVLTGDEVVALLKACSRRAPTGIRNAAAIAVLYRGGLRLGELLALRPKDVDAKTGSLTVLHGKGDRRRTIGLDPGALALVARWVDRRRALGLSPRAPLFSTLDGRPLKPSYMRTLLPRLAAKAGISKRVHPHGLRHTLAFEMMMEGKPMVLIQQTLGHASLSTTERYLSHICPKDVIEAMRAREWAI